MPLFDKLSYSKLSGGQHAHAGLLHFYRVAVAFGLPR